ncbi:MAG: hypothetical protein ACOCV8_05670, partial [Spirochaetota bacterium]
MSETNNINIDNENESKTTNKSNTNIFINLWNNIKAFFKDLDWLWVLISIGILALLGGGLAYLLSGALKFITLGNQDLAFWILFVILSGIGGMITALISPGITTKEPAIASVFVTLGVLLIYLVSTGFKISTLGVAVLMGVIAFFVVLATAKFGEKKQEEGFEIKDTFQSVGLKGVFMQKKISEITREDLADLWLRLKMDLDIFKDLEERNEVDKELSRIKEELNKNEVDILQIKADLEIVAHNIIEKRNIQNKRAKLTKFRMQLNDAENENVEKQLEYLNNAEVMLNDKNPELPVIESILNNVAKKIQEIHTHKVGRKLTSDVKFFPDFLTILMGTATLIILILIILAIVGSATNIGWYRSFTNLFLIGQQTPPPFAPGIVMLVGAVTGTIGLIRHMTNKINTGLPSTILFALGILAPFMGAFFGLIIYSLIGNIIVGEGLSLAITMLLAGAVGFAQSNFIKLLKPLEKAFSPESVNQAVMYQRQNPYSQAGQEYQRTNLKLLEAGHKQYGEASHELIEEKENLENDINRKKIELNAVENKIQEK